MLTGRFLTGLVALRVASHESFLGSTRQSRSGYPARRAPTQGSRQRCRQEGSEQTEDRFHMSWLMAENAQKVDSGRRRLTTLHRKKSLVAQPVGVIANRAVDKLVRTMPIPLPQAAKEKGTRIHIFFHPLATLSTDG